MLTYYSYYSCYFYTEYFEHAIRCFSMNCFRNSWRMFSSNLISYLALLENCPRLSQDSRSSSKDPYRSLLWRIYSSPSLFFFFKCFPIILCQISLTIPWRYLWKTKLHHNCNKCYSVRTFFSSEICHSFGLKFK